MIIQCDHFGIDTMTKKLVHISQLTTKHKTTQSTLKFLIIIRINLKGMKCCLLLVLLLILIKVINLK